MHRINLDFVAGRPRSLLGVALLLCGVMLCAVVMTDYRRAGSEVSMLEQRFNALPGGLAREKEARGAAGNRDSGHAPRAEELAAINAVVAQLSLPWEGLFGALEAASGNDIALLSIEPDAARRVVRVTAESREAAGMLVYVRKLQQSSVLSDVMLQTHDLQLQDSRRPVRFVIGGAWGARAP